jgi:phosphoribosylaminoimidazolecarboxamide formyltransferase / IMP cyclohydrolase
MAIVAKAVAAPDKVQVRRALISVYDKSGIVDLARRLAESGVQILSTGGTSRALAEAGLPVTDISEATGYPEILDGRVKTLHPSIHGGLLAIRGDPDHRAQMEEQAIEPIDLVVVNLYPFESVARSSAGAADVIENIDIGGPAMIRAAAKNHNDVAVVTDPADYALVMEELAANDGCTTLATRRHLAARAFARTAAYDTAIADWFGSRGDGASILRIAGRQAQILRYGENPHQTAALYVGGDARPGVATARQLQGKELSYNNLNDADAAFELASEFDSRESACVAIIKHANPCGVAIAGTLAEAYRSALACDPVSAFGGVVAVNRPLDAEAARLVGDLFTEVIIAPAVEEDAREYLAQKKNLRLLVTGAMADPDASGALLRSIAGGFLVQSRDNGRISAADLKVVTKKAPDEREIADLVFAFTIAKHVKSNAIVYARNGATVGIGAGQMSRVDSSRIAARKAEDAARQAGAGESLAIGSVVASDAFFPFPDGLLSAVEAGATAAIQPGGSMRDEEVIAAADEAGIAMVFTGMRHFRH